MVKRLTKLSSFKSESQEKFYNFLIIRLGKKEKGKAFNKLFSQRNKFNISARKNCGLLSI
jgi:hypothetical protein